jgi:hypothetical protein
LKKLVSITIGLLLLSTISFGELLNNRLKIAHVTGVVRWSQIAFGPDGVLHCVFEENTEGYGHPIWYVSYDGKTASAPFNVSNSMTIVGQQPYVTVNAKGMIAVVWGQVQQKSSYLRIYDPVQKIWLPIETAQQDIGAHEPSVALDSEGNVHITTFNEDGRVYARSKINGVWEEPKRLNSNRAKDPMVAIGKDGRVWASWRENMGNEYKLRYSKRTKDTSWAAMTKVNDSGASISHPSISVGPDNAPWIAAGDVEAEGGAMVFVLKYDDRANFWNREEAIGLIAQHYPRIAIDKNNIPHVASQWGAGDSGNGILYTNKVGGSWKPLQFLVSSQPKVPGIAADAFGNVVVCFSSIESDGSDVWIDSLSPVSAKHFYPPVNLTSSVQIKSLKKSPSITYNLGWSANSDNNAQYLEGYNIYAKSSSGGYELLLSVAKSVFSATFTFEDLSKKRQFGIATVSLSGAISEIVNF